MSDEGPTQEGCPIYNSGGYCRAHFTSGCPFVHDYYLYNQAREKRRAEELKRKKAAQKKTKDQMLAESRAKLQEQYSNTLAIKGDNAPKVKDTEKPAATIRANIPIANTVKENVPPAIPRTNPIVVNRAKQLTAPTNARTPATITAMIESLLKQTNAEVQNSTAATFELDAISSLVTKINNVEPLAVTVAKFATVHRLSWATVTYSKPNAQSASQFPKTSPAICRYFANGCRKGDRCNFTHMHRSPTNPQAPWPHLVEEAFGTVALEMEPCIRFDLPKVGGAHPLGKRRKCPPPRYTWDVYNIAAPAEIQAPKPFEVEYQALLSTLASKGIVSAPPKLQHAKTLSATSASTTTRNSVTSSETSWGSDTCVQVISEAESARLWALECQREKEKYKVRPTNKQIKAPDSAQFHPFQQLPTELRIKIWRLAMTNYHHTARIAWRWDDYYEGNYYRSRLQSMNPSPAIMRVNKEARGLSARYHYDKCFATMQAGPETWFNFDYDRVFIQTANPGQVLKLIQIMIRRERESLQFLQLPLKDWVHNPEEFSHAVACFTNLKILYLLASVDPLDEKWTRNPRMASKVKKSLEWRWNDSQTKNRPKDKQPLPHVQIELLNEDNAVAMGVDGIQWGGSIAHFERIGWKEYKEPK